MAAPLQSSQGACSPMNGGTMPATVSARGKERGRAGRKPDDFPRLVTGFIIGIVLTLGMMVANVVAFDFIDRRFLGGGANPPAFCQLIASLAMTFTVGAMPVVCAAALAKGDRVEAARQTLSYCYTFLVVFVVICGRPLPPGSAFLLALVGVGGLGGVCATGALAGYLARLRSSHRTDCQQSWEAGHPRGP